MELRWERTAVSETQPWAMKLILHLDTKEITCYSVLTSLLEPLCVLRDGDSCWVILCCCMLLSRFQNV